jgi:hypothetical protein
MGGKKVGGIVEYLMMPWELLQEGEFAVQTIRDAKLT